MKFSIRDTTAPYIAKLVCDNTATKVYRSLEKQEILVREPRRAHWHISAANHINNISLYLCHHGLGRGKHFFDFEDGDFAHSISDNMAIDSDGDLLMRMGDNMAMDLDSGELHIISGWSNDEDEN